MSPDTIDDAVESVQDKFEGIAEIDEEAVRSDIEELVNDFQVPLDEATMAVESNLEDKHDVDSSDSEKSPSEEFNRVMLSELKADEWVDVVVKFVQDWNPDTDSKKDAGLVVDEEGSAPLNIWADSGDSLPSLEEGETYRIQNVVVEEFNGDLQLQSTPNTQIEVTDEDVDNTATFSGNVVKVYEGSGLIERCSHDGCSKKLNDKGECYDHGHVNGEYDLRLKLAIDNGLESQTVFLQRELTTELTGIDLEDARQRAQDALDVEVVYREMKPMLIGHYMEVEGIQNDDYFLADEASFLGGHADEDLQTVQQLA